LSGGRRASVADSINNLTKSFSAGSSLEFDNEEIFLHRRTIESALCEHYSDNDVQVSKMKVKRCSSVDIEVYKLDVWIRGAAGKRKLSLLVRKEDQEKDRECLIYKTVIEDIRKYLAAKPDVNRKYLPISEAFDCHNGGSNSDNNDEDNYTDFFIIEDIKGLGYRKDILSGRGLDYEHSILAIATISKFHAVTYCYRKENSIDIRKLYPVLGDVHLSTISSFGFELEIEKILVSSGFEKYSELFLSAVKGNIGNLNLKLDKFGVLCHGNVCRENILFKYRNQMDMKQSCQEVSLLQLHDCFYGSCVLDLVQFLFECVDCEVRQSFIADFICSVYYDNFAKTVAAINPSIGMFSKKEFIKEVANKITYGFFVTVVKLEHMRHDDERMVKNLIVSCARDIVQFKINAEVTIQ